MSSLTSAAAIFRLRLGIILFALFWLPAYLLAPVIGGLIGKESNVVQITIFIMVIQTFIGLAGALIAGKQLMLLLKGIPRKKIPKTAWHLFWSGQQE